MEFRQLEYFIAVCDNKSFTRASEKLFISQPAITNAINNLENELGIKLFNRSKRLVELTAEGLTFYRHVSAVLNDVDHILLQMNQLKEQKEGVIKIAVNSILSDCFFLPFYFQYMERNPKARIVYHLSGNEHVRNLVEREVCHLGLCIGARSDFPQGSICLLSGKLTAVGSKSAPRFNGAKAQPILMNTNYSFTQQMVTYFKSQGDHELFCYCDNLSATKELLNFSGGHAYLPDFLCQWDDYVRTGLSQNIEASIYLIKADNTSGHMHHFIKAMTSFSEEAFSYEF